MTRRKRLDFVSRACIGMFLLLFGEIVADTVKDQALPGKSLDFDQSNLSSNETFPPKNLLENNGTNLATSPSLGASAHNSSFSSRPSEIEEQDGDKSNQDAEDENQAKSHVLSDETGSDQESVPTSATSLNMQDDESAGRSDRNSTTDKLPSDPASDPMADKVRLVDSLIENVDKNASLKAAPKEPARSSTTNNLDTSTPSTLTAKLESKRDGSVNLPEVRLADREDDERDREATTQSGDHRELSDEGNDGPKDSTDETHGSESFNLENTGKTKSDGVSLANDTRVNYGRKDQTGRKEDGSEDPKGEVEVIKDVSHPPLRKLVAKKDEPYTSEDTRERTNGTLENELDDKVGAEVGTKEKFAYGLSANASEDSGKDSSGSTRTEEVPRKKAHAVPSKPEDDANDGRGTVLTTTSNPSLVPRGRTIAFSGANEFSSTEEKTSGSVSSREAGNGHDSRDKGSEVSAKKNASGEKIDQKPYPYVKSTKMTPQEHVEESFDASKTEHGKVLESTSEESSAYENTISRRQESETKFVVTEPSVVIENSIQQFKTTYDKRSGNATGAEFTVKSQSSVGVTLTSLETSGKDAGINSTLGDEKKATALLTDSSRTTVADDVSHRTDVVDERKEITGKDENFDVTGNGITEISPKSDESSYGSSFHADVAPNNSTTGTPDSSNVTTTTEKTKMSTNVDVQTDAEESSLMLSTLNVTETSTEYPLMKSNLTEDAGLTATTNEPSTSPATVLLSNDTESETLATTSPTFTTTPMTSLTSDQGSNDTAKSTASTRNLNETSVPMTTTTIEYEFVGLTDVTEPTDEALTTDRPTTHSEDYAENFTTPIPTTVPLNDTTVVYPVDVRTFVTINHGKNNVTLSANETKTVEKVSTTPKTHLGDTAETSSTTPSVHTVVVNPTGLNLSTTVEVSSSSSSKGIAATGTIATGNHSHKPSSHSPVPSSTLRPRVVPSISDGSDGPAVVTTEKTMEMTTETTQILPPDDIPLLVRIVIVGSLSEVCPHVPKLRQVLAEMLNSELSSSISEKQIIFHQNPCPESQNPVPATTDASFTSILVYVVDEDGKFDAARTKMLPSLNQVSGTDVPLTISSIRLVQDTTDSGNAIAVVIVCSVAFICLVLLAGLLFIMRKRQTRFNYGERCRPVSLDAYSLDSVSAYNSVRRKGVARSSKRSYGNPTFEDSSAIPSHPLNFAGLSSFHTDVNAINEEFSGIPQVWAKIDELPAGAEVKNRYANVIPLPETRVPLQRVNNDPLSEYINASYVRGPKNATKYYIACQAPMDTTVTDFWRMIWEQQSKVIIMLTDLVENGIDKCTEYIPPSEVTDCHRLYGDFQVTLKKRETKEKYAISTLHLKNLENNTFREVYHIWYLWPVNGVQSDGTGLIAILLEARALQRGGPGPIVVHCSPGTGRTGTLIALDLGIRQYEITRTVDVPRVVYTIRRDRAGAVQTKEQYGFIYKALNLYATKLAGGVLESS